VFQYGEIYNFPQAVFEKALDDEEMVQEDTEAGGDDESASEPEDDEQVRISYCIRGQRDLCSVSVNLLSASKNISVPGLIPGAGVVICLERAADLYMAQLMPLPLTVSCFTKIQIGFTFLVPAHLGSPRKGPLNGCVCLVP